MTFWQTVSAVFIGCIVFYIFLIVLLALIFTVTQTLGKGGDE